MDRANTSLRLTMQQAWNFMWIFDLWYVGDSEQLTAKWVQCA